MYVTGAGAGGETLIMAACFRLVLFYFLPPGPRGQTRSDGIIGGSGGLIKANTEQLDRQSREGQKDLRGCLRIRPT